MVLRNRSLVVPLLACLLVAVPAAGAGFFVPTAGPYGRDAVDVAAAPNGSLFAAGDPRGVYILEPGGTRWARLPDPPDVFRRVEVGPDGKIWVFGWAPVFVSSDGGASWPAAGPIPAVSHLTFDVVGGALAGTQVGLYRSADGGASWTLLALPTEPVDAIETDLATIWVAIGTQLYRSDDVGATWTPAATLPQRATALAAHPDGGVYAGLANVYSSCTAGGIFRVTAAGVVSRLGLEAFTIQDILVRNGSVLVSAADACSYYQGCGGCNQPGFPDCGTSGVYRSTDGGTSWTRETAAIGVPRQLVVRNDGTLFTAAGASSCDICWTIPPGVQASPDGGATWSALNDGIGKSSVYWVAAPPNTNMVYAANSTSVYASVDRGANWTLLADMSPTLCAQVYGSIGFAALGTTAFSFEDYPVRVHRVTPQSHVYVTPPPNMPGGTFGDMIVTGNGTLVVAANSIHLAPNPLASGFLPFAFGPSGITRLAPGPGQRLAGTTSSSTWLSNNTGFNWTNIANVGNGRLAFSPDGSTLYVVQGLLNETLLWRLRESNSWQPEAVTPFPGHATHVWDLLVDPAGALYVMTLFNYSGPTRILRLGPGAPAWNELDAVDNAQRFVLAPDGYLYVATGSGVWRSTIPVGLITDVGPPTDVIDAVTTAPNPLSEQANIRFHLARAGAVHLAVFDVRGRLVSTLLTKAELGPGPHDVTWRPAAESPNGVYVYRLRTSTGERSGRMLLLR